MTWTNKYLNTLNRYSTVFCVLISLIFMCKDVNVFLDHLHDFSKDYKNIFRLTYLTPYTATEDTITINVPLVIVLQLIM